MNKAGAQLHYGEVLSGHTNLLCSFEVIDDKGHVEELLDI